MTERIYVDADWPHGLRCVECHVLFVEGQPIAERLDDVDRFPDGEPVFTVTVICAACSLAGAA